MRDKPPASPTEVERVDGGAGKTRDAHVQYTQTSELRYEPAHELPRTGAQIESAQAGTHAQELHDGAEEGQIVIMPDERKAKGLEVGKPCLCALTNSA